MGIEETSDSSTSFYQKNKRPIIIGIVIFSIALITLIIVLSTVLTSSFGKVKQKFAGHSNEVAKVIELPNKQLASISYDQTIRVWKRSNGLSINSIYFQTRAYSVPVLVLIQNGNLAATRYLAPFNIEIFSPVNGNVLRRLRGHTSLVTGI